MTFAKNNTPLPSLGPRWSRQWQHLEYHDEGDQIAPCFELHPATRRWLARQGPELTFGRLPRLIRWMCRFAGPQIAAEPFPEKQQPAQLALGEDFPSLRLRRHCLLSLTLAPNSADVLERFVKYIAMAEADHGPRVTGITRGRKPTMARKTPE